MDREEATKRCKSAVKRIHSLPTSSKITASCKTTLLRLLNSELNFLSRLSLSPSPSSSSISCNVGYLEAIVHILEQPYISGVSRICKSIPLSSETSFSERNDCKCETVHIDIVCSFHKRPTWFIVSDRNPKYISWNGKGKNDKGLRKRIEGILHAARNSQALRPAFVILFFANGLELPLNEMVVKEFGFRELKLDFLHYEFEFADTLDGGWINVLGKSYHRACTLIRDVDDSPRACGRIDSVAELSFGGVVNESTENYDGLGLSFDSLIAEMREWPLHLNDMQSGSRGDLCLRDEDLVNFDTTALIAIVSGISNGGAEKILATPENQLRQRFKINTEFVISQAQSEIKSPIHVELCCTLSATRGIACERVHSEFMQLVSMCGGPNERLRADQLVNRLKIVPDSPSPRIMCLPTTRKLALKNKVTFGTGDYWGAPTLTANMGFVRAVSQTGMSLFTLEHRPRALIGD